MAVTRSFPTQHPSGLPVTDTRRILAGLLVRNADGTPRAGVLPTHTGPLVTGRSSMGYDIAPFVAATSRVNTGVELVANDAVTTVSTTAAPAANSRIDVIWVRSQFAQHGDASNDTVLGVTQGNPAPVPVKPQIPAGALELATAEVLSSSTTTASVVITQTAAFTASEGSPVPFRSKTDLDGWTTAKSGQKAYTLNDLQEYTFTGTRWGGPQQGTVFRRTSAYTFTTTESVVAWNAADFQSDDFTHSSGTITFRRPGTYLIAFCVTVSAAAAGNAIATLRRNGGGIAQVFAQRSPTGSVALVGTIHTQVGDGDTLALTVMSQGRNVAADTASGRTFISITPVR